MTDHSFLPPPGYENLDLYTTKIKAGTPLYRIYGAARPLSQAIFYGKTKTNRFDDPRDESVGVGVCYFGKSLEAAIVETVLHSKSDCDAIPLSDLESLGVIEVTFDQDIELVWFTSSNLKKNKTTAYIYTCPHEYSQQWAEKIIINSNDYSGIYFPCSHNDSYRSIAMFEGRGGGITVRSLGLLSELDETYECLVRHKVGVS